VRERSSVGRKGILTKPLHGPTLIEAILSAPRALLIFCLVANLRKRRS
jgi:hypothetical protein